MSYIISVVFLFFLTVNNVYSQEINMENSFNSFLVKGSILISDNSNLKKTKSNNTNLIYKNDYNIKYDSDNKQKKNNSKSIIFSAELNEELGVYQRSYSLWDNNIDYSLIKANNYTMLGASVFVLGFLYLMPESFTNWDKDDAKLNKLASKWWDNVRDGPVVDKDDFFLNYVAHPYCGAVYYMAARSAGANIFYSFLYSVALSTFFWEYGIEAFAEIPSIQDLIVTPIVGSVFGEGFYLLKRNIIANDNRLFNSTILGRATMIAMDPITEVSNFFINKKVKKQNKESNFALYSYPTFSSSGDFGYQIMLSFKF